MKSNRNRIGNCLLLFAVITFLTIVQFTTAKTIGTMGLETIGNEPLNAANYTDWKNILPVANHGARVYHTWVNGDERFYYKCDIEQLNQLLGSFSQLDQENREIVILPGPGSVSNFAQDRNFGFNCEMHLVGGIAKFVAAKDKGSLFWPSHPRLTIKLDEQIDLNGLKIPKNCQLVSPAEMKRRYTEGLTSKDVTIRGWGSSFLSAIDPYDRASLKTIASLLDDKDDWVALNAIGSIGSYGIKAIEFLPRLEMIAVGNIENKAMAAQAAINSIKTAGAEQPLQKNSQRESDFRERLQTISTFIKSRNG